MTEPNDDRTTISISKPHRDMLNALVEAHVPRIGQRAYLEWLIEQATEVRLEQQRKQLKRSQVAGQ